MPWIGKSGSRSESPGVFDRFLDRLFRIPVIYIFTILPVMWVFWILAVFQRWFSRNETHAHAL